MRDGDLIILLGAGCSVEAGIPASRHMVTRLEDDLASNSRWEDYRELYYFLKAALIYADCMKQRAHGDPDIERVVNTLGELEKNRDCTLYPFIGARCQTKQLRPSNYWVLVVSNVAHMRQTRAVSWRISRSSSYTNSRALIPQIQVFPFSSLLLTPRSATKKTQGLKARNRYVVDGTISKPSPRKLAPGEAIILREHPSTVP